MRDAAGTDPGKRWYEERKRSETRTAGTDPGPPQGGAGEGPPARPAAAALTLGEAPATESHGGESHGGESHGGESHGGKE